ncbi:ATP-dependent helicase [Vibrio parahaemolyticus]|nr:ATP-dependent helicase [Vibrio parahaemolyticus]
MTMKPITDKDISDVEKRLSLGFDDGSKEFIKCSVSKDIQACPGAGKTTSLVAKLDVLSRQMPFPDKSGILVLTHTNVAVDEVKSKLGYNASKLLGYPNHIGTFQSFVNKYLATPMYIKLYSKKPEKIDSELFEKKLKSILTSSFIGSFILARSNDNNYNRVEKFINALEIRKDKICLKQATRSKTIISNKSKIFYRVKSYLEKDIVGTIVSDGYITFSHCYELANRYLEELPEIGSVISSRFKYVFVDEAQDTDSGQFELLKKIFGNSKSIIQRIGDNDQSIFNFDSSDKLTWDVSQDHITISDTKRLSKKISKVASNFSITNHNLTSNNDVDIDPVVLVFEDDNIEKVVPKFAELIKIHNLHLIEKPIFKAIGNIGKAHDTYHTIPSYVNTHYEQDAEVVNGDDFRDKLISCGDISPSHVNIHYWAILVQYLGEIGFDFDGKKFNRRTLTYYLKVNNRELLDELNGYSLSIFEDIERVDALNPYLVRSLQSLSAFLGFGYDEGLLLTVIYNYQVKNDKKRQDNISIKNDDTTIDIYVSTIHKAKGETHTATLILETYKNGYDINQLLPLLKGKRNTKFPAKKKVLYVGMTRPTHLLCLAIHRSYDKSKTNRVTLTEQDLDEIRKNGYEVIDLATE